MKKYFISLFISVLFGLSASLPVITIKEKAGASSANYPVTLSLAFIEGEISTLPVIKVDGNAVTSQADIKRHWPGGSIKHALVSFMIPSLNANASPVITVDKGGLSDNTPISKNDILATDFDAKASFTLGGTTYTASARDILQNASQPDHWLSGPIATELILRGFPKTAGGTETQDLAVQFLVRFYQGLGAARVSFEVENVRKDRRQDVDYNVSLSLGNGSSQQVYSKNNVKHYYMSRWRKVTWWGSEPSETEIRLDVPYMMDAGFIHRYDTTAVPSESKIAGRYQSWQGSNNDILENGFITPYFGTTGARDEIGPQPAWTAQYILSQDNRLKAICMGHGDLSGSFSIHWRESEVKRLISVWDYPTVTVENWAAAQWSDDKDKVPDAIGTTSTPYNVDGAHQPAFAYIPYLFTGDYYYLEELYYWSNYNIISYNFSYREKEQGLLKGQNRRFAWTFRTMVEAAAFAPDSHFEKVYFDSLVKNNIRHNHDRLLGDPSDNVMGVWVARNFSGAYCPSWTGNVAYCTAPFETDFITTTLDHAVDLGYEEAVSLRDFTLSYAVGRFCGNNGFDPDCGAPYKMPTVITVSGNEKVISSWAEMYQAIGSPSDCQISSLSCTQCYPFVARAALSAYSRSQVADGSAAYTFLDNKIDHALFKEDPCFALMPGPKRLNYAGSGIESGGKGPVAIKDFQMSVQPNPFRSTVVINVRGLKSEARGQKVVLKVYDITGKTVFNLAAGRWPLASGISWNASNIPNGLYVVRATIGSRVLSQKITLIK